MPKPALHCGGFAGPIELRVSHFLHCCSFYLIVPRPFTQAVGFRDSIPCNGVYHDAVANTFKVRCTPYKDAQVDQPGSATIWWWVILSNAPRNRCGEIKCAHKCCLARPILVLASQSHEKEKKKTLSNPPVRQHILGLSVFY